MSSWWRRRRAICGKRSGREYGQFEAILTPGAHFLWIERDGRQVTNAERLDVAIGDQPKYFAVVASPGEMAHDRSITATAMGPIVLGVTLEEARREAPAAEFRRATDGDGAALVRIAFAPNESLLVWTGEEDPAAPIDWTRKIQTVETLASTFTINGLIAPGTTVAFAADVWGPVQDIVESEIESRQFVTFERQPAAFTLRLDYTGEFPPGSRHTTRYQRDAKILSIAISLK